jgi:cell division septum initiation protein DivIVA
MPRGRRNTESVDAVVDRIQAEVTQLIEENKNLKKELARLQSGTANGVDRRVLAGLQRRLETALGQSGPRTRTTATATTTRRKITDPAVLEKRRAALAKARSALAEKRAAAQP